MSKKEKKKKGVNRTLGLKTMADHLSRNIDAKIERFLVKAVCRLPKVVQQFVLKNCYFVSAMRYNGACISISGITKRRFKHIIIILNGSEKTVAHEIAHAWLGHDGTITMISEQTYNRQESAANRQVKKWGFI